MFFIGWNLNSRWRWYVLWYLRMKEMIGLEIWKWFKISSREKKYLDNRNEQYILLEKPQARKVSSSTFCNNFAYYPHPFHEIIKYIQRLNKQFGSNNIYAIIKAMKSWKFHISWKQFGYNKEVLAFDFLHIIYQWENCL